MGVSLGKIEGGLTGHNMGQFGAESVQKEKLQKEGRLGKMNPEDVPRGRDYRRKCDTLAGPAKPQILPTKRSFPPAACAQSKFKMWQ